MPTTPTAPASAPDPTASLGAVLLAAGQATRMGGAPKCLLEIDGVPLVRRQAQALLDAGCSPVVVVLGHECQRIAAALAGSPLVLLMHPDHAQGQASSLRAGLRALPDHLPGVLVALADMPFIGLAEIQELLTAWAKRPAYAAMLVPQVHGLPGNPVVLAEAVRQDLLHGNPEHAGKHWQAAHPQAVFRWPTGNENYRLDVDTADDVARISASTGVPLLWPDSASPPSTPSA